MIFRKIDILKLKLKNPEILGFQPTMVSLIVNSE